MRSRLVIALSLAIALGLGGCAKSRTSGSSDHNPKASNVTVFAASSLTQAFTKLGKVYEHRHPGSKVRFNLTASDTLATQIKQGAPADVFAAAGTAPMDTVTSASLAAGKPQLFVSNPLVIITPKGNPAHIRRPQDLAKPGVKLVLAAPGVPAGDYARQMLDGLGIGKDAAKNVVSNEVDDKSVVSKILLGDADAGIVYVSDLTPDVISKVTAVHVPPSQNVIAHYPIVALKNAADPRGAKSFVNLVLSATGKRILRGFGFGPP